MRTSTLGLLCGALLGVAILPALVSPPASFPGSPGGPAHDEATVRIGTYDSRAIAVAYAPSRFNPVREKMAEHERAKAAGDEARIAELEAWGEKSQRALHRQGFGIVPVGDLLAHVADGVAEVAREKDLVAIARHCDHVAANVELVDVTDDLVRLYDPSEKTLRTVAELRDVAPVDLDELDDSH